MERDYIADNDAERARLKALVGRLSDEELSQPMPAGWTVAGVLAHIAYWEGWALHFLNQWLAGTAPAKPEWGWGSVDPINDAAKPLCLAMPVRLAAELALRLADETDAKVAALPDAVLEQALAIGLPFNLSRATHRREHLDEIEASLASPQ